jgi:hypothetical protein
MLTALNSRAPETLPSTRPEWRCSAVGQVSCDFVFPTQFARQLADQGRPYILAEDDRLDVCAVKLEVRTSKCGQSPRLNSRKREPRSFETIGP